MLITSLKNKKGQEFSLQRYESAALSSGAEIITIGYSLQNRPIKVLRKGKGDITVLFISRIHGNEPATTEALLQFFDEYHKDDLSLYGIFLANPDGAALYEKLWKADPLPHWKNAFPNARLNANGVDINRDCFDLSQPETKAILKLIRDIKPDFAVDLHEYYWSEQGYPPKYPTEDNNGFMATMTDAPFCGAHTYVRQMSEEAMHYLTEKLKESSEWLIKHRHFVGASHNTFENPAFLGIYLALRGIPKLLIETWGTGCSTLLLGERIRFHKAAMNYLLEWLRMQKKVINNKPAETETLSFDVSGSNENSINMCLDKLNNHHIIHSQQNKNLIVNCSLLETGFVKTIFHLMFEKENINQ